MVVECWSIVLLLAAMGFTFWNRGLVELAVGTLPLQLLPLMHLLSGPVSRRLADIWSVQVVRAGMDLAAVALSCVLIGMLAHTISSRKVRRMYYLLCSGFTVLLSLLLICSIFAY